MTSRLIHINQSSHETRRVTQKLIDEEHDISTQNRVNACSYSKHRGGLTQSLVKGQSSLNTCLKSSIWLAPY